MSLLEVYSLSLGYDSKVVVSDLSFSVNKGDFICVVGENGSGKTTLIKGILGLISRFGGKLTYGDGLQKNEIGYLSQQPPYSRDFPASVREIVMSGFLSHSFFALTYSKAQRQEGLEIMKKVGVESLKKRSYSELSGGQQQRVLLARALCATRKLLLLDEPTSALDPLATNEFYSLIHTLNSEGTAVIMVSHDINAAVRNASHILHLGNNEYFFGTTHEYMHSKFGSKLIMPDCPCDVCSHRQKRGGETDA